MSHRRVTAARSLVDTDRPTVTVARVAVARAVPDEPGRRRRLEATLVPWDTAARVSDDGRTFYDETWERGSLVADDVVAVYAGHTPGPAGPQRGPLIGRAVEVRDGDTGCEVTLELADTAAARDTWELADTVGAFVSLEAAVMPADGPTVVRSAATPSTLTGVAVILPPERPAFAAAAVTAARSDPGPTDPAPPTPPPATPPVEPDEVVRGQVAEAVRTEVARYASIAVREAADPGPLSRYHNFAEVIEAARALPRDQAQALSRAFTDAYHTWTRVTAARAIPAARAWVDQVTPDNPGLMGGGSWLTTVFGIVDEGRPAIVAMGGTRDPGDSGLDVYWPFYDGDLRAIVAQQLAEKTEINSVKVSFKRGQATLKTYAGGSDVSYQLQRRSTPAYMGLYDRVLQLAYGLTTENVFADELAAGAAGHVVYDPAAADPNGAVLRTALFAASSKVRRATGAPATVVLASTDEWERIGGIPGLYPSAYGTANVSGTAQASTLSINVSGLVITEAPDLPPDTILVTNPLAAAWFEEGPFLVTADDVAKLGTDVAIWGMGSTGLFTPAGIVELSPVATMSASSTNDKSAKASK